MSAVSLTAVGVAANKTAPYSLTSITGTVYDSGGTSYTIPTPKSLVFFRNKTFTPPFTVPGPPTNVSATAGNAQASVSWTAPTNNGGVSISSYTVTSSPGGLTATTTGTSATVTGLTNGTAYTFTVKATNSVGQSVSSSPSNSVTPVVPVNNLMITTAGYYYIPYDENEPPGYSSYISGPVLTVTQYGNGNQFEMTGGNEGPIYVTFRTNSFNGTTLVQLNNVDYGNSAHISIYFPYGLTSGTGYHGNAPNGGSVTISQTRPTESYLTRVCQDANGNAITCP